MGQGFGLGPAVFLKFVFDAIAFMAFRMSRRISFHVLSSWNSFATCELIFLVTDCRVTYCALLIAAYFMFHLRCYYALHISDGHIHVTEHTYYITTTYTALHIITFHYIPPCRSARNTSLYCDDRHHGFRARPGYPWPEHWEEGVA